MPTKLTNEVLSEADRIVDTWTANPDFKLGTVTLANFTEARTAMVAADAAVETKRTELAALMNTRDDQQVALGDLAARARAGFKAIYDPDSTNPVAPAEANVPAGCTAPPSRRPPSKSRAPRQSRLPQRPAAMRGVFV